jgi:hypothetical protein
LTNKLCLKKKNSNKNEKLKKSPTPPYAPLRSSISYHQTPLGVLSITTVNLAPTFSPAADDTSSWPPGQRPWTWPSRRVAASWPSSRTPCGTKARHRGARTWPALWVETGAAPSRAQPNSRLSFIWEIFSIEDVRLGALISYRPRIPVNPSHRAPFTGPITGGPDHG